MTTFLAAKISVLVCEYSPHVTITTQRSSAMCAFVVRQPDPHRADVKVAIPHGPLLTPVVPTPTIDNQRLTLTHSIQTFFSLRRRPCRRHCWRRRCSIHAPSVVAVQRYRRIVVVVVVTTNHKLHCCTNAIVRSFVALDKKKTTTRREKVVSVCRWLTGYRLYSVRDSLRANSANFVFSRERNVQYRDVICFIGYKSWSVILKGQ